MDRQEFKEHYDNALGLYQKLLKSIDDVISSQLSDEGIPYLHIQKRIKSFDSCFEKVNRKHYQDPFEQIEDFCGLRIVCYYPSDVERIAQMLRSEFDITSEEDTQARLKPNEFGYRSLHFIVSIPNDWLKAPPFRGLGELKAEVQIRTILMHAWAEIQHKLAYKSVEQVPQEFQRKLFRISAKFEEADEQLEQIRNEISAYRAQVRPKAEVDFTSLRGQSLNLDTLSILLDAAFPTRVKKISDSSELLSELLELSLTMDDLIDAIVAVSPFAERLEKEDFGQESPTNWTQTGALRNALDINNETYFEHRFKQLSHFDLWLAPVEAGKRMLRDSKR